MARENQVPDHRPSRLDTLPDPMAAGAAPGGAPSAAAPSGGAPADGDLFGEDVRDGVPLPTRAAALARLARVNPGAYARTRNALDGAVTGLSPWITHGLITLPEVAAAVAARHALPPSHKLVAELGWRAFFRHRWAHLGTDILRDIHPGPRPAGDYARELPADIREGRTGVPAVDQAVRTLLRTGGLHNHARMWLASYVVHLRGVHWRAGADWMIGWLLDGDLASNHLSWQWIAGTGSHQPYLFNADNVAKYAPREWHSRGTVIDTSYEQLGEWAAGRGRAGVAGLAGPDPVRAAFAGAPVEAGGLSAEPPPGLDWRAPDAADVAGRTVWLVSPWSLGAPPPGLPADAVRVALWWTAWHEAWPWSAQRRAWVGAAWREVVGEGPAWAGDAAAVAEALRAARAVVAWDEPHWRAGLPLRPGARSATAAWPVRWVNPPDLFGAEARPCKSFSAWWHKRMDPVKRLEDLPGWA